MMREIKPLLIVIFFSAVVYIGVEPVAHIFLHKKLKPVDYTFSDLKDIDLSKGNPANGKELVLQNCIACHSLNAEGMPAPISAKDSALSYGVVPPDLSDMGMIYSSKFLVNFLANPVKAINLEHKFTETPYPMPGYDWLGEQGLIDIAAYFKSIAKDISDKEVFTQACARCHTVNYGGIEEIADSQALANYMGVLPPDLSTHLRSRGIPYLNSLINNPQDALPGTAMPRVGLSEKAQTQVISYLESVSDPKKEERETLGMYFIGYFILLSILAYLWKRKIWSEVK